MKSKTVFFVMVACTVYCLTLFGQGCSDGQGHTFATTPAGVQVFNAKGEHLGDIEVPLDQPPQNCGFAGAGKKDLFVVGRGVVLRIHTINAGPKDRAK